MKIVVPYPTYMTESDLTAQQRAELLYIGAVLPQFEQSSSDEKDSCLTASELLMVLREDLHSTLVKQEQPIAFKMSGGLDSRLLAFLLKDIWDSIPIEVHIVFHPSLGPQNDLDVFLAQKTLKYLGFNGSIELQPGYPGAYLRPLKENFIQLTGIYGTEILGGLMFEKLPVVERLKHTSLTSYLEEVPQEYRLYIQSIIEDHVLTGDTSFFCQVFLNSPLSTIYNSVHSAWRHPNSFKNYCIAPFSFPNFVRKIMKFKKSRLEKYELYHQIFQLFPAGYREIPLCSDYTDFKQHAFPPPAHLVNAKTLGDAKL